VSRRLDEGADVGDTDASGDTLPFALMSGSGATVFMIPDVERFPCFTQFSPAQVVDGRTPSMSDERIAADLDRIVAAATELLAGAVTYEQALSDYFRDLTAATGDIWSIDGVHLRYV